MTLEDFGNVMLSGYSGGLDIAPPSDPSQQSYNVSPGREKITPKFNSWTLSPYCKPQGRIVYGALYWEWVKKLEFMLLLVKIRF